MSIARIFNAAAALVLGLGIAAAQAQPTLSNSQEPGSFLVFPYFQTGTVNVASQNLPASEFHISVLCPQGVNCPEGEGIKLQAHWVCPGSENPVTSFVCKETDFVLFTTVNGEITLSANGQATTEGKTESIPAPPCAHGYLVAFVVNQSDQPIKWDGLIGDASIRSTLGALAAYNAVPIQAANTNPSDNGQPITVGTDPHTGQPELIFDGLNNDYALATGQISGPIEFDNTTGPLFSNTYLILLTLDTQSGFPNNPTFAQLQFFNAEQAPTSTSVNFVCWKRVDITKLEASLNAGAQGSAQGTVYSGQAVKIAIQGISDGSGPATLLGLFQTTEGAGKGLAAREIIVAPYNNSYGVPTAFAY
jgi:hypothetical protein